jgi:uncharacterized protein with ATP-grasp and redox domains
MKRRGSSQRACLYLPEAVIKEIIIMLHTTFNCIPCLIAQAIETVELSIKDKKKQHAVINSVLHFLEISDLNLSPPELLKQIYKIISEITGNNDPYHDIRLLYNKRLYEKYDDLKRLVYVSSDPVQQAVKLAAAGNILEFKDQGKDVNINEIVDRAQNLKFGINDYHYFIEDLARYKKILYLTDNSGEIVFDRLLIEIITRFYPERNHKVTFVVRGTPLLNDATREDAELIELDKIVSVMDSGDNAPAMIFDPIARKKSSIYHDAELVIAKGPINFELLYDEKKLIYFIFKVQCNFIAGLLNTSQGTVVLKRNSNFNHSF